MMLPAPPRKDITFWRLDHARHADTWLSGIGSERGGGRWNSRGVPAVYASADPATAILELAVHKGFDALDRVPHVISSARITDPTMVRTILPSEVPNANWLVPGTPGRGQQQYGDALLEQYPVCFIPSIVSRYSWNLLINPATAHSCIEPVGQEPFALDTRLNPPEA